MSRTPAELETELLGESRDQIESFRIINYLASLQLLAKRLGRERAASFHARAGLLIKSYAEAPEEEKP